MEAIHLLRHEHLYIIIPESTKMGECSKMTFSESKVKYTWIIPKVYQELCVCVINDQFTKMVSSAQMMLKPEKIV